jgi:hypothetical protein
MLTLFKAAWNPVRRRALWARVEPEISAEYPQRTFFEDVAEHKFHRDH